MAGAPVIYRESPPDPCDRCGAVLIESAELSMSRCRACQEDPQRGICQECEHVETLDECAEPGCERLICADCGPFCNKHGEVEPLEDSSPQRAGDAFHDFTRDDYGRRIS